MPALLQDSSPSPLSVLLGGGPVAAAAAADSGTRRDSRGDTPLASVLGSRLPLAVAITGSGGGSGAGGDSVPHYVDTTLFPPLAVSTDQQQAGPVAGGTDGGTGTGSTDGKPGGGAAWPHVGDGALHQSLQQPILWGTFPQQPPGSFPQLGLDNGSAAVGMEVSMQDPPSESPAAGFPPLPDELWMPITVAAGGGGPTQSSTPNGALPRLTGASGTPGDSAASARGLATLSLRPLRSGGPPGSQQYYELLPFRSQQLQPQQQPGTPVNATAPRDTGDGGSGGGRHGSAGGRSSVAFADRTPGGSPAGWVAPETPVADIAALLPLVRDSLP